MTSKLCKFSAVAVTVGLLVGAVPAAKSAVKELEIHTTNLVPMGNTLWKVTWDESPDFKLFYTFQINDNDGKGLLREEKKFKDSTAAKVITFENENPGDNTFGLRFTLSGTLTNNSTDDWAGFKMNLAEMTTGVNQDDKTQAKVPGSSARHPAFAHFHNDTFKLTPDDFTTNAFNTEASLVLTAKPDKKVAKEGGTLMFSGLGMHEFEVKDLPRKFQLIETPVVVPEPSTLLLFSVGLVSLVGFARERRKKAA
jgi:hypothetical protein